MDLSVSPEGVFEPSIRRNFRRLTLDEPSASSDPFCSSSSRSGRPRAPSPSRTRSIDACGNTALIQAVIAGSRVSVERCLARGCQIDAQNFEGQTALFVSCATRRADIAEVLLRNRADPNISAMDGASPLHAAATGDDERLVAMLLDAGASRDARDDEGDSPLHWAAREGCRRAAGVLLRRGADPGLSNEDGETPLDVDPGVILFGSAPDATVLSESTSPITHPHARAAPPSCPQQPSFQATKKGAAVQQLEPLQMRRSMWLEVDPLAPAATQSSTPVSPPTPNGLLSSMFHQTMPMYNFQQPQQQQQQVDNKSPAILGSLPLGVLASISGGGSSVSSSCSSFGVMSSLAGTAAQAEFHQPW